MKSLVDIAKEMGFEPNPNLTKDDWGYLVDALKSYFAFQKTGLDSDTRQEQKRLSKINNLPSLIYYTNCLKKREGSDEAVQKNLDLLKSTKNKLAFPAPQSFPGDLETTPFIWHHSKTMKESLPFRERFTVDIDLSSQKFPDMMKNLDRFIADHPASYKITNNRSRHRIDTLNMYLSEEITPEIAQEFYSIVKPCLDPSHHQQLNGQEIFIGLTPVQGIKIGPILSGERESYDERIARQDKLLQQDIKYSDLQLRAKMILKDWVGEEPHFDRENDKEVASVQPSLGMVSTAVELMNLMYYMLGKEGQNPFQLLGYDNKPYQKRISFNLTTEKEKPKMADSILKKMTSFLHKDKKQAYNPDKDFGDSHLWSDVKVRNAEGVCYGHRINITSFTAEERNSLKDMLKEYHIQYTERQATTNSADIRPGDLTIRVTDPDSVRQLRSMVFKWAEGPHARPVFKTNAEYDAEQKIMQEKRSVSVSLDEKPKWADKRYWNKVAGDEKGYVMDLGTAARYNDLGQPQGAPFSNIEIDDMIKKLAEKGIQTEKRPSGLNNGLPSYKMTHDSLVIMGDENTEKFERMFLQGTRQPSLYASKGKSEGR